MSIAFEGAGSAASSASAASATITFPGSPGVGQMLLAAFSFEGVAAGSGPWVASSVGGGWSRCIYQAPSATGCGLEVWNTQDWTAANSNVFNFIGNLAYVGQGLVYSGPFPNTGGGNVVRFGLAQQWTGNNPISPSAFGFADDMAIVFGSEQMSSPGFGAPASGYTQRLDSRRGAFGNAEITAADLLLGFSGLQVASWTANAASGASHGATGILLLRGSSSASTAPLIIGEYPVPL